MDAIFTFHSIDTSGSVISYSPDDLEAFLDALEAQQVRVVPIEDILRPQEQRCDRAVLTFDDAVRSVHRMAFPSLVRRGFPAITYAVSGWVGETNRWPSQAENVPTFELMRWEELEEWAAAGLLVGSHTVHHESLPRMADGQRQTELADCRALLEEKLGTPVKHFAYPYGSYDRTSVTAVQQVYDSAVTTDMGFVGSGAAPHLLPRIDMYYLKSPAARSPLFGSATRRYLYFRKVIRKLRHMLSAGSSG